MQPSNIAKEVSRLLLPFIREQASRAGAEYNDPINSVIRRCYHLSKFNILKLEGLTYAPLNGQIRDKIKICALPFKDLPSAKLEELLEVVRTFKTRNFKYIETMYFYHLWSPVINSLFVEKNLFQVDMEHPLFDIEPDYPEFRTDIIVSLRNCLIGPLLFVELSRDHLLSEYDSHKDEDKIAISMAASLLKIIGQFHTHGIEFLEKLAVYGILGAASDFDVVSIYPVFTSPENVEEFYFVFNSSKKYLRFNILERSLLPENMVICSGNQVLFHDPIDSEPVQPATVDDPESINVDSNSSNSNRIIFNKVFCEYFFKEGVINENALQVLERVAELVKAQADLIENVPIIRISPSDPRFKYDSDKVNSMVKGRDNHTDASPAKTKKTKLDCPPPDATRAMIYEAISLINNDEKENTLIDQANNNMSSDNEIKSLLLNVVGVTKYRSKHEVTVYEVIKGYDHFPKMVSHFYFEDEDGDSMVKMELELLKPLSKDNYKSIEKGEEYLTRILFDIMGSLRILHSKGYVHGDVTPGNIGYSTSKNIWNLFDFDNCRPIKESSASGNNDNYKTTRGYTSENYISTGIYYPFDDYLGLALSCEVVFSELLNLSSGFKENFRKLLNLMINCKDSNLSGEKLDFFYLKALKLHLETIKSLPVEDPSIGAALPLLKEMKIKYN